MCSTDLGTTRTDSQADEKPFKRFFEKEQEGTCRSVERHYPQRGVKQQVVLCVRNNNEQLL